MDAKDSNTPNNTKQILNSKKIKLTTIYIMDIMYS